MTADGEFWASPRPFWFASRDLLTDLLGAEINSVTQFLAKQPEMSKLFDDPEATVPQRSACFTLLAHRKLMDVIYGTFTERYEQSPSFGDAESNALRRTNNLVTPDVPTWVFEMNNVVEGLAHRIYHALPEPLRAGGYDENNAAQMEAIESAKKTLSNVEQITALIGRVLDQQLQRLLRRWSAAIPVISHPDQMQQPLSVKGGPLKGLGRKNDLSQYSEYMHNLTEKQHQAFSLKYEYELSLTDIAIRMGIDRKTAYEHIDAAKRKIDQARSSERRKAHRAKSTPES
jgi:DNA-binding CsgD family transcriptional regulator